MTGYDCQQYEALKQKVANAGFRMEIKGDTLLISNCGGFGTVTEAFQYMCGYERGKEAGHGQE